MKNKLILGLGIFLAFLSSNCMERPHRRHGPTPVDIRKIGILSWGSIVRDPRDLKIQGSFEKSALKLPIELVRLSGKGTPKQRITRIIDREEGVPLSIWHATSSDTFLPAARANLQEREGTVLGNIFYIKTMLPNRTPDSNEKAIVDASRRPVKDVNGRPWFIVDKGADQLSSNDILSLANWASQQGYDAVMWTGLGRTSGYESIDSLKKLLASDRNTANNTVEYIKNGPAGVPTISPFQSRQESELTPFEMYILNKYAALE